MTLRTWKTPCSRASRQRLTLKRMAPSAAVPSDAASATATSGHAAAGSASSSNPIPRAVTAVNPCPTAKAAAVVRPTGGRRTNSGKARRSRHTTNTRDNP